MVKIQNSLDHKIRVKSIRYIHVWFQGYSN